MNRPSTGRERNLPPKVNSGTPYGILDLKLLYSVSVHILEVY